MEGTVIDFNTNGKYVRIIDNDGKVNYYGECEEIKTDSKILEKGQKVSFDAFNHEGRAFGSPTATAFTNHGIAKNIV